MTILHADIDAFFASVEQARNPALRDRPVIVGNGCIASCCYRSRAAGCEAGMSLSEARARCPEAVILDGSEKVYRCYSHAVFELCRQISPIVETQLDDAYIDLSGMERLYPDPRVPAERLRREVRQQLGLPLTVGIGANRMLARMATTRGKPDGLCWIRPGDEESVLATLPVGKLPGIGRRHEQTLSELNIHTVLELRAMPEPMLVALFGKPGRDLYLRARGHDPRGVRDTADSPSGGAAAPPSTIPGQISRETHFHTPTSDRAEIDGMLAYLVERAMRSARQLQLAARTLRVRLRYQDGPGANRQRSLPAPTDLDDDALALARELLDELFTRRVHLRFIGVQLSNFRRVSSRQLLLFDPADETRRRALAGAIDGLRDKYGHAVLIAGSSAALLGKLRQETYGFVLRTPSLTK